MPHLDIDKKTIGEWRTVLTLESASSLRVKGSVDIAPNVPKPASEPLDWKQAPLSKTIEAPTVAELNRDANEYVEDLTGINACLAVAWHHSNESTP